MFKKIELVEICETDNHIFLHYDNRVLETDPVKLGQNMCIEIMRQLMCLPKCYHWVGETVLPVGQPANCLLVYWLQRVTT